MDNGDRGIFLDSKFDKIKITELPPGAAVSGPYHVARMLDRGPKDRYLQWLEKASLVTQNLKKKIYEGSFSKSLLCRGYVCWKIRTRRLQSMTFEHPWVLSKTWGAGK